MKQSRVVVALVLCALVALAASQVQAYGPPKWHVGDRVEVQDIYTSTWEKATITEVRDDRASSGRLWYKAHLDRKPPNSTETDLLLREDQIRAQSTFVARFRRGDTVDVYYSPGQGKNRGTVLQVGADGRYKIHYPGCTPVWDEWIDHGSVLPPARLSRGSAAVRFLVGRWIMFTPSYPTTVTNDGKVYREYGTGARTPPLVMKGNGRYVWYFDFGKRPVRGRWVPDARVPGASMGTQSVDGLIIKDPTGKPWKVYKREVRGDRKSHLTAQRMCSGITDIGTKI
jgi:hypothetical protein